MFSVAKSERLNGPWGVGGQQSTKALMTGATEQYRADWELAAAGGEACPGGVLGVPSGLVGPLTPNQTRASWKTIILKNGLIFLYACGYVVDWPHVAQVRFWRPKRPHLERSHVVRQSPSLWDRKCRLFKKKCGFIFLVLWVKKDACVSACACIWSMCVDHADGGRQDLPAFGSTGGEKCWRRPRLCL